ncbi:MAG TPA: PqqD family protein [Thermoanaerobaculia bacterium]|nr:PqqD family protein [Thermoanaerobaculia bacterium]
MTETVTPLDGGRVFRRSTEVVARQVGLESILVPIRHNVGNLDFVYTLSPVAARIWALLDGTRSIDAIVTELCQEFEVDRATAMADVSALVSDLAEASLVNPTS